MDEIEARTMRKVLRRFVPLLVACFVVGFLDRVNVGFAALTMSRDLGFSATVFGLGAGLFFVSYFLLEVPSNLALERYGARRWIARIMATWGVLSMLTAFVWNEWSFYGARILLGAAEAGFFPGVVLYLTYWIPNRHRGRVVASFMAAMPLASVIGSPISGYLMSMDGLWGLKGWQLLYLVEGLPAVLLAGVVLLVLRDSPSQAEWLAPEERAWLAAQLASERGGRTAIVTHGFSGVVSNPLILLLSAVYFGIVFFNFGLSFFLPQIVHGFGLSLTTTGLVAALPFLVAAVGMVAWGRRSDRRDERRIHLVVPMALAVAGLGGSTLVAAPVAKLVLLCVAAFGVFSALPVFWALLPGLLSPAAAAIAFAVVNSLGNLSGFAAPYIVGAIKDATGHLEGGLQVIAGYGIVAIVILVLVLRRQPRTVAGDWGAAHVAE
ncbi:MFS transporter [Lichenibacterium dinghuense]|uniref:MFS transporter n=1 Tax=Lichenibacterium dinghuense TaxID=2895977 RepID=UPI001F343AA6|nr:MFS transporter [Lichenibacterium sp. 6Y81]